uniref:Methyltransferase domain-containing protein n=1 Tax=Alexandrium catenella TaxID=2925 RepID=A0A7S1WY04_ALECA|mmetsp:Transcript_98948/g.262826  ORF Transcript_98948/g.262826 Transcript_98948/m.262826 type:complete len:497 (+) Transcript_98948:66-1556(+)
MGWNARKARSRAGPWTALLLALALWHAASRAFTRAPSPRRQSPRHRPAPGGLAPRPASSAGRAEAPPTDAPDGAGGGLPSVEGRPGFTDREAFREGPSVSFWRDFDPERADPLEGVNLLGEDLPYWLYHLGRTGFFMAQGVLGVALAAANGRSGAGGESILPDFLRGAADAPAEFVGAVGANAAAAFAQDLGYIRQGCFKMPYDMAPRHRQWSPAFVLDKGLRYVRESARTLRRSARRAGTEVWVNGEGLYPEYYRHTFHYQSDGWLSSDSAAVYETSTETLFAGRQDAMQRTTLVHLSRHLEALGLPEGRGARLLELACGTGRLLTFARDSWPGLSVTASDLSPYYLEEARRSHAYWEREFAPRSRGAAAFAQANAEALPFAAESFDAVISVYLFHELPAAAQDAVVAEAARVLRPGGLFVLTDSVQLGDRPSQDGVQGRFGGFAEPHYQAYIRRDLAALARAHGLRPHEKEVSSATKSLSFLKPHAGRGPPGPG